MNNTKRHNGTLRVSALPVALFVGLMAACVAGVNVTSHHRNIHDRIIAHITHNAHVSAPDTDEPGKADEPLPAPIEAFMERGLKWIAAAQQTDGGWGGGSHANQGLMDPHAVKSDPGTTAFAAMALMRAGNTTTSGEYKDNVRRALEYLLKTVENYSGDRPTITDMTNTQPQVKLGPNIDVSLCSQFFSRMTGYLTDDPATKKRVEAALDKCTAKIQGSQKADGSWNHGGWAPVMSTTMANTALENAQAAGRTIDKDALKKVRDYQKNKMTGNAPASAVDGSRRPVAIDGEVHGMGMASGRIATDDAAGVALYSIAGNQRANAVEATRVKVLVDKARKEGKLTKADTVVTEDVLVRAGMERADAKSGSVAYGQNLNAMQSLKDERTLSGFGNNGGEEFLSYMLTSESLVLGGGEDWAKWNQTMHTKLAKIQNDDGSWSGHHCITSPVFCTAAVILCLTADRDPLFKQLHEGSGSLH